MLQVAYSNDDALLPGNFSQASGWLKLLSWLVD